MNNLGTILVRNLKVVSGVFREGGRMGKGAEKAKAKAQRPVMRGWGHHLGKECIWESEQGH